MRRELQALFDECEKHFECAECPKDKECAELMEKIEKKFEEEKKNGVHKTL